MLARLRRPRRRLIRLVGGWTVRLTVVSAFICCVLLVNPPEGWAVADIPTVIKNLRNWVVGMLSGLATLFLTFGGLRYLMAGGDPGEVESAKRALKAAAIGYGLAILAPVLVTVLQSIVGAGTDGGGGK
ncbi:pilin [Streptomyces sp. Isolate_219]|uniref:pilin n=1 Tax=Streptomyces sp. Isolate_219 TaxID=2950110 RepID=UPI0021C7152E|nr:pilin [Streptomyces sp. Isolate_219]MCR8573545.1 pilin [Streptomyces sp. Isolate_219]